MHAYEELTNLGIIFQKRGMGFYLSENAVTIVADLRRNDFEMVTLPDFIEKLRASGYPVREAIARIAESLDGTDR